jgi:hypothetical protein
MEGTMIFIPAVVCLLLALQWGGSKYEWSNGRIIALFVIFGVLIICFTALQIYKGEKATVPPRLLMNRNIWGASLFAFCLGGGFFILVYYVCHPCISLCTMKNTNGPILQLPIWFQAIKGASAVHSAIMNLPIILAITVFSISTGFLVTLTRQYIPCLLASSVFQAVGAGILTMFQPNTGHSTWIPYQVPFGIGMGLGIQVIPIIVQNCLDEKDVPIGTAIVMFAQTLGGALFISVGQNVFTNKLLELLRRDVPEIRAEIVLAVGATELKNKVPQELLARVLEDYNKAITTSFYAAVAMGSLGAVGALAVEWKPLKKEKTKKKDVEGSEKEKKDTSMEG